MFGSVGCVIGLPFRILLSPFGTLQHGVILSLAVDASVLPFTWGLVTGALVIVIVAEICFWLFCWLEATVFICWSFALASWAVLSVVFQ